jgi:hypothetical protein
MGIPAILKRAVKTCQLSPKAGIVPRHAGVTEQSAVPAGRAVAVKSPPLTPSPPSAQSVEKTVAGWSVRI